MAAGEVEHRKRYQHQPLKHQSSIRLARLLPGTFNTPVSIQLIEVSLENPPPYKALSYVWGSPVGNIPVSCHGQELLITENCVAALRRIRSKFRKCILWIDSICIDQSSTEERNHQVALMGDVYSMASEVIIWLGEKTPYSDFAMSFLTRYHWISKAAVPEFFRSHLLRKQIGIFEAMKITAEKERWNPSWVHWGVLGCIYDTTWFKRKWTIQEFILGRCCYFQYGGKRVETSKMFTAIRGLITQRRNLSAGVSEPERVPACFAAYMTFYTIFKEDFQRNVRTPARKTPKMTDFLRLGRFQAATNPKDAVFGMYGVLQKLDPTINLPDYSKSLEEIYIEATKLAITHDDSLDILLQTFESGGSLDIPSWVPNWNVPLHHGLEPKLPSPFVEGDKSGAPAKASFLEDGMSLSVLGYFVSRVTGCSKLYIPRLGDADDFPEFEKREYPFDVEWINLVSTKAYLEWIDIAREVRSHPTGKPIKEVFGYTLVPLSLLAVVNHREYPTNAYESWLQTTTSASEVCSQRLEKPQAGNLDRAAVAAPISNDETSRFTPHDTTGKQEMGRPEYVGNVGSIREDNKVDAFASLAYSACLGTRLFVTSAGYIGRGLKEVQEGDLVVLISGVSRPLIVRKEGETYRLRGPCHVEGIMNGEKWPDNENDLVEIILR